LRKSASKKIPPSRELAIPEGKIRICVSGYSFSLNYTRAYNVAFLLAKDFPDKYSTIWTFGPSRANFFEWLTTFKLSLPNDSPFQNFKTSPFIWFERNGKPIEIIGGRDKLCEYAKKMHPGSKAAKVADKTLSPFEDRLE